MLQDYYNKAGKLEKLLIKAGILYGVVLTVTYALFRAYYINFDGYLGPLSLILYLAELHTILLLFGMFYSLWPRKYKMYEENNSRRDLQVNMFVTVAGEPVDVVRETIEHAKKAADYYKNVVNPLNDPRVIVLNDGRAAKKKNWKEIRKICDDVGVEHIAREIDEGFKAGNINNGLKEFPADDPHNTIDCFFDSDFCAKKNFLIEILKPLVDDGIDFVQSPQRYKNLNTWVAKAAGAHQIFFFDYICPAKSYDNALFLCGTNYAIRRQALIDVQGVDNRFVTEDYATSIKLHLLGKRGVFISKVLALGMAPMNLKEYFNQQTRWCKGCLDANRAFLKDLLFGPLNFRQKFHYFISTIYYFIGVRDAILVLAPIPFLFFGISLIRANTSFYLVAVYLPLMVSNFLLFSLTFRDPIKSLVLDIVSFPVFAVAFISSVIKRDLPFTITIKKYEKENPFRVYRIQLMVAATLLVGIFYSYLTKKNYNPYGRFINYFWATYDVSFLVIGFWLVMRENLNLAGVERFAFVVYRNLVDTFRISKKVLVNPAGIAFGITVLALILRSGVIPVTMALESKAVVGQTTGRRTEVLVPGSGIYYGYYSPELDKHPKSPKLKIVNEESPTLALYYEDWNENSKFDKDFMQDIWGQGAVPVITWEPWDTQGEGYVAINERGYPQKMILAGYYDGYIREFARGAKDWGQPFFLRFAHEMNGNWYPWGDFNKESSQDYVAMWRHVHDIFEDEGADNVIWVWSPNNTDAYGATEGVLDFYPGYDYVDWTAFSAFNWGGTNEKTRWMDFKTMSWDIYSTLEELGKPIMVAETSSVSSSGNKTGWFAETLLNDIPEMPLIRAVVIYNAEFPEADFQLSSGMDERQVIQDYIIDNGYFRKGLLLNNY